MNGFQALVFTLQTFQITFFVFLNPLSPSMYEENHIDWGHSLFHIELCATCRAEERLIWCTPHPVQKVCLFDPIIAYWCATLTLDTFYKQREFFLLHNVKLGMSWKVLIMDQKGPKIDLKGLNQQLPFFFAERAILYKTENRSRLSIKKRVAILHLLRSCIQYFTFTPF